MIYSITLRRCSKTGCLDCTEWSLKIFFSILLFYMLLSCESSLYILKINLLSYTWFSNIVCPLVYLCFYCLLSSLAANFRLKRCFSMLDIVGGFLGVGCQSPDVRWRDAERRPAPGRRSFVLVPLPVSAARRRRWHQSPAPGGGARGTHGPGAGVGAGPWGLTALGAAPWGGLRSDPADPGQARGWPGGPRRSLFALSSAQFLKYE